MDRHARQNAGHGGFNKDFMQAMAYIQKLFPKFAPEEEELALWRKSLERLGTNYAKLKECVDRYAEKNEFRPKLPNILSIHEQIYPKQSTMSPQKPAKIIELEHEDDVVFPDGRRQRPIDFILDQLGCRYVNSKMQEKLQELGLTTWSDLMIKKSALIKEFLFDLRLEAERRYESRLDASGRRSNDG